MASSKKVFPAGITIRLSASCAEMHTRHGDLATSIDISGIRQDRVIGAHYISKGRKSRFVAGKFLAVPQHRECRRVANYITVALRASA